MAGTRQRATMDRARDRLKDLERRFLRLEGQLKVLQGQVGQARGKARVRLARLEKDAESRVEGVRAALGSSRDRVSEAVEGGRQRVEKIVRGVEPKVQRSVDQGRELLRVSAAEARLLSRGLKAGVKAGREAFHRARRRR